MFQNWGFLLGEIWLLLLIAALLGLFCGWLIWGGRSKSADRGSLTGGISNSSDTVTGSVSAAVGGASAAASVGADAVQSGAKGTVDAGKNVAKKATGAAKDVAGKAADKADAAATAGKDVAKSKAKSAKAADPSVGSKPKGLEKPRDTGADDLKQIKGIGPKLEKMLHGMGVYHFDQIASWGAEELAWVDSNLEGFFGRASRDNWIGQAKEFTR